MLLLQIFINGILIGGIYGLISIGLTLIFGVVRVINFAHGEFLMLSMYTTYFFFYYFKLDPYLSIFIVTPLLFMIGLMSHRLIIKPVLSAPALIQMFITFMLSITLQNLALLVWKADYRSIKVVSSALRYAEINISVSRLFAFVIAAVISVLIYLFLEKTYSGKAISAIAQDRDAARLMGINVDRMYMVTFGIGSACVGVAGSLLMPIYYVFPGIGTSFVMVAFVVVVLGGMGNLIGAILGGLIIGLVESFSSYLFTTELSQAFYYLIFIAVLIFRPQGLMGILGAEEMGLK